jgi:hypothetical protein
LEQERSSEGLEALLQKNQYIKCQEDWRGVNQEIGTDAAEQRLQAFFNNASVLIKIAK